MRRGFSGVVLVVAMFGAAAFAEAPGRVNLQGVLRGDDGALRDGAFAIRVQIFSKGSDTALLDENHADTPVTSGIFSVEVGGSTPNLSVLLAGATEPEVQMFVNGSALPRQPLGSVMYALHANTAPFSGLQNVPAPCAGDTVLTGYQNGSPVCTAAGSVQRRTAANSATCPAGQFLKAIAADGTPVCGSIGLVCASRSISGTGSSVSACAAGEVVSGGGCSASGGGQITFAGPVNDACTGSISKACLCLPGSRCAVNAYQCNVSSGTVNAIAVCCTTN
jgi:hypothetical protein